MKNLIYVLLIACVVLGLYAYKKHTDSAASNPATEPSSAEAAQSGDSQTGASTEPVRQPQATTSAAGAPPRVPAAAGPAGGAALPAARNLAPEGTYYVIQSISITDDSGIVGITPGTRVTLVEDKGASKLVSDGRNKFEVTANQITNDLDVVDQIRKAQAQAQMQAAQIAAAVAAAPADSGAQPVAVAAAGGPVNEQAVYQKQKAVQGQIDALTQQKAAAENQIAAIRAAIAKQEDRDTRLGWSQLGRFDIEKGKRDIKTLEGQRDALGGQISQLQAQLSAGK